MIEFWEAFWLGLTQGITEFLPVSSSGHLEIMQKLFGSTPDNLRFLLEFINLGTLLVLIIYYRKRIAQVLRDLFVRRQVKLLSNIIITCVPAVIFGLLLSDFIENSPFFSSMLTLATTLAVFGVLMIIVDKIPHLSMIKDETKLDRKRALYIGLAQVLAFIPGASRSGTTILAGRLVGMNNRSSADYSFLVSIPLMLGVVCHSLLSGEARDYFGAHAPTLLFANLVAFVVGSCIIRWALNFLRRKDALKYFGWYRVILAGVILIFLLLQ